MFIIRSHIIWQFISHSFHHIVYSKSGSVQHIIYKPLLRQVRKVVHTKSNDRKKNNQILKLFTSGLLCYLDSYLQFLRLDLTFVSHWQIAKVKSFQETAQKGIPLLSLHRQEHLSSNPDLYSHIEVPTYEKHVQKEVSAN